jgi:hypothetical protein
MHIFREKTGFSNLVSCDEIALRMNQLLGEIQS